MSLKDILAIVLGSDADAPAIALAEHLADVHEAAGRHA